MPVKVIKSGRRGEVKGEVKTSSREVRLSALKGLEALQATTRVGVIYSLLYDADTRVRAVARKELLTLPTELIGAYITEGAHPKVLDFIIRNLPKNSPLLPIIASAPNLAHRSKQFLTSQGIEPAPLPKPPIKPPEEAAPKPEEPKLDVDLEWKPGMDDFELPDGVDMDMPIEDDEKPSPPKQAAPPKEVPKPPPKPAKPTNIDQEDTVPGVPPPVPKAPEPAIPVTKERPPLVRPKSEVAAILAQLKPVKKPAEPIKPAQAPEPQQPPPSDPFKPSIVEKDKEAAAPRAEPQWAPITKPLPPKPPAPEKVVAPPSAPTPPPAKTPTPPPKATPTPPPRPAPVSVTPPPAPKPEPVKKREPTPAPQNSPMTFMLPISPDSDMDEERKKISLVPLPVADGDLDETDEYSSEEFYPPAPPAPAPAPVKPIIAAPPPPPPPPPTPPPPPPPTPSADTMQTMFPVADQTSPSAGSAPISQSQPAPAATPSYPTYQGSAPAAASRKSNFATGLFAGLIIVLAITAAVYAFMKFYPSGPKNLDVNNQADIAEPADTGDTDESPVEDATPTTPPPVTAAGTIDVYIGTYKNLSGLRKAQQKAEALNFVTSYTQKEDETTSYGISCGGASSREAADRKASGIKSLGIPASVSCNSDETRCSLYCGTLTSRDAAEKRAIALRASGYGAGISERKKKTTQYTLWIKDVPAGNKDATMKILGDNGFKPKAY